MSLREKMAAEMRQVIGPVALDMESSLRLADAALRALRPTDAVQDLDPVVLYFPDDASRAEFIDAMLEAKPNLRAVPVP